MAHVQAHAAQLQLGQHQQRVVNMLQEIAARPTQTNGQETTIALMYGVQFLRTISTVQDKRRKEAVFASFLTALKSAVGHLQGQAKGNVTRALHNLFAMAGNTVWMGESLDINKYMSLHKDIIVAHEDVAIYQLPQIAGTTAPLQITAGPEIEVPYHE